MVVSYLIFLDKSVDPVFGSLIVRHNFKDVGETEKRFLSLAVRNDLHGGREKRERRKMAISL